MKVRRFCNCGVKLERDVADEDTARKVIAIFWREYSGADHHPVSGKDYAKVIAKIIKRNYERKQTPQLHKTTQLALRTFRLVK